MKNLCTFVGSYSAAMGRTPPIPLMPKLNPVWDVMQKIVGGSNVQVKGAASSTALQRQGANSASALSCPSLGLFDGPAAFIVHRQGPLQNRMFSMPQGLYGTFAPRFNLMRQEI